MTIEAPKQLVWSQHCTVRALIQPSQRTFMSGADLSKPNQTATKGTQDSSLPSRRNRITIFAKATSPVGYYQDANWVLESR